MEPVFGGFKFRKYRYMYGVAQVPVRTLTPGRAGRQPNTEGTVHPIFGQRKEKLLTPGDCEPLQLDKYELHR